MSAPLFLFFPFPRLCSLAHFLLTTTTNKTKRRCLELGVGSGYVIASAARLIANRHRFDPSGGGLLRPEFADKDPASSGKKKQAALFAVDVSPAAARDASATLRAHYQGGDNDESSPSTIPIASVDVALADLAAPFLPRLAGAVDLLLFNPPYVLTPKEEVYRPGTQAPSASGIIAAAWAGGDRGREVVDRALPLIARFLRKGEKKEPGGGVALVVALAENDVPDLLRFASTHGLSGEVVAERSADEERLFVLRLVLES